MKQYSVLNWLVLIVVLCAIVAAGFGLFTPGDGNRIMYTTVRNETVEVWGQGFYRYDTPIGATGFIAADVITLLIAIPILIISLFVYQRGSLKGGLFLAGAFGYFLYNYTSMGFGAAYNNVFLAYIIIFAASLYGFILSLLSFDLTTFPARFGEKLPRNGIGIFLIVSGVILGLIWLGLSIIPALIANKAPLEAYYYTTFTTGIVDVGLVAPAFIVAGVLVRRGTPFGYLLASTMLILTCILGAALTAGGIVQVAKQVVTVGQAMVFTVPFVILALIAIYFTVILFRNFSESFMDQKGVTHEYATTSK